MHMGAETAQIGILAGVIATLVGTIAWTLKSAVPTLAKQYRDDVFLLKKEASDAFNLAVQRFEAIVDKIADRHEKELIKRDIQLDRLTQIIDQLSESGIGRFIG